MSGSRRRAREQALQILYQMQLTNRSADECLIQHQEHFDCDSDQWAFVCGLARGVDQHRAQIEATIAKHSLHWKLPRIAPIDYNLLCMGIYEICIANETPAAIVIDELVEIAKRFGQQDSAKFINGILDASVREQAMS